MFVVLALWAAMVGYEYQRTEGFTVDPAQVEADRKVMLMERIEDQPLGEYPADVSLDAAKAVADWSE